VGEGTRTFEIWIEKGTCEGRWQEAWPKGVGTRRSGWEFCKVSPSISQLSSWEFERSRVEQL
jgi:hypothetical protein